MTHVKPYLMSLGVAAPLFGIYAHWYIDVERKYRLRTFRVIGFRVTLTSYRKVKMPDARST